MFQVPVELQGWDFKLTSEGLVFESSEQLNPQQVWCIYCRVEDWLESMADKWGEVSLKWNGCKQGLRKFGKHLMSTSASNSNAENLNNSQSKTVTTTRIEEVDPPELLGNLDLNILYQSPYPVYINSLEDQSVLFLNPAALRSQGRKPSDINLLNAYSLNFEDELQSRDRHLRNSLQLDQYEYQALRWYQSEEGIWQRKKMDFCTNFKKVTYLDVECRLGVVLEAVPG